MFTDAHLKEFRAVADGSQFTYRLNGKPNNQDVELGQVQPGTIPKPVLLEVAGDDEGGYFVRVTIAPKAKQLAARNDQQPAP